MKRIVIVILVAIAFVSCANQEKKAQKLIKEYLKETLNDTKSYEVVSFGELQNLKESAIESLEYLIDEDKELYEEMKNEIIESEMPYWIMSHKFRAKNEMNSTMLNHIFFYFDKEITEIIEVEKK